MTTILASEKELRKFFSSFHGQTCWNVCSCRMGHSLLLFFGGAVECLWHTAKGRPIKWFGGQYELLVYCSWRLDDEKHTPICSSASSEYHEIKTTMISLEGDTIESIGIIPPVWEMTVYFSSGKQLRIFCDNMPSDYASANCSCSSDKENYYIGAGQEIRKNKQRPHLVSDTIYTLDQIDLTFVSSDRDYKPMENDESRMSNHSKKKRKDSPKKRRTKNNSS